MVLTVLTLTIGLGVGFSSPAKAAPLVPPCQPCADPRLAAVAAPLNALYARLQAEGQSVDPFIALLREGLAKRVPPPRLLAAGQTLVKDLKIASELLAGAHRWPTVPAHLPMVLVDALRAQVAPALLRNLLVGVQRYGAERTVRAVETLTDLTVRGFPVASTAELVQRAARARRDLESLPGALVRTRHRLGSVGAALAEVFRSLSAGEDLERLGGPGGLGQGRGPNGGGPPGLDDYRLRGPNRDASEGRGPPLAPPGRGRGQGRGMGLGRGNQ